MSEEITEYRGWFIYKQQVWSGVFGYYAKQGSVRSAYFPSLAEVRDWVDGQITQTGGTGTNPDGTFFSPDRHNWVGHILSGVDDARENKLVALGPAPPGLAGKLEGALLVLVIARLSKTPQGMRTLNNWGVQYLKAVQAIITGIATSSSANALNCIFNGYLSVRIYQRMGLISAHDAIQTAAWFDHCFAELLKKDYFSQGIGGLTTLVNATSETGVGGERATGLASLAKLLEKG